uniref:DUF4139 domain-containing protein n=1 Tax=Angiostrongylus cantonensis TaxID=6313 RepID=A0A158PBD7_ANGCA
LMIRHQPENFYNFFQLCCYGVIEQNTGDNWNNTGMVLSTSTPSVGGSAPQLATLSPFNYWYTYSHRQRHSSAARRKPMYAASEEDMGFGSFDCNDMTDAVALHRFNTAQQSRTSEESSIATHSIENLVSTCFSVPRILSIPSNGVKYKVLIATVRIGTFSLFLMKKRSDLRDIFLFSVATFSLLLSLAGELNGLQVGFMSKNTLITHEHVVSLRNAKVTEAVQLTVWEQIPKSTDEKIKVCVVSPDIRGKSEAVLNKDHNLEWKLVLASGEHKDLYIKYTVEHPASELISYKLLSQHSG